MSSLKVTNNTPDVMTDVVYLHLQPRNGGWGESIREVQVVKTAKSLDAAVEPHTFIVKVEVAVPKRLFAEAIPSARIEIQPGDVVPVVTLLDADTEGEAGA